MQALKELFILMQKKLKLAVYILDEFRGLSLANELVDYLVKETKKNNLKEVYCLPFEELKHFYQKFGFKEIDYESKQINNHILKKFQWCLDNYQKFYYLNYK